MVRAYTSQSWLDRLLVANDLALYHFFIRANGLRVPTEPTSEALGSARPPTCCHQVGRRADTTGFLTVVHWPQAVLSFPVAALEAALLLIECLGRRPSGAILSGENSVGKGLKVTNAASATRISAI